MKLVIIEGVDRTGKDTLVGYLQKWHKKWKVVHWTKPVGETDGDKKKYQKAFFEHEMLSYQELKKTSPYDILIWNRGHIGEFVYGTMYRNTQPSEWVSELEKKYLANDLDVYLILLVADPEFVLKNDDGDSFSTKIEDKRDELRKFTDAVFNSKIPNKKIIKVHNETGYLPAETIASQVDKFIHYDGN